LTAPLEDYALIGDGESGALVGKSGSIDWLCWPRFDSDACFAALLGDERNGHWLLAPQDRRAAVTRRYRPDTLILETDFAANAGSVRIVDFMPIRDGNPAVVRLVRGIEGSVPMQMMLRLRFGYGVVPPWPEMGERCAVGRVGPDLTVLYADLPLARDGHDVSAKFTVGQGQSHAFVLQFGPAICDPPAPLHADRALAKTEAFWRDWINHFDQPTDWPDAVRRSLITLKALINGPTGGIVAALTTSLPEIPGGEANWDYRYCWLRDSSFTIESLLNAGYEAEARRWRDWILRTIAGTPEHIQIMYRIDGGRHLDEWKASWLPGYRWAAPVRIGNSAAKQKQIDVYGELVEAMDMAARAGIELGCHGRAVEQAIVDRVEAVWRTPGHGMWEHRGEPRHYVYGKVMAWVALDRFLRRRSSGGDVDREVLTRIDALRTQIHDDVCREGFDSGLNSFVQYYGGQDADASLLLMPIVGFLPVNDPRVAATISRIERELMDDGLVYRSTRSRRGSQGAFMVCSCWLADCRRLQGRTREARATLERLLEVRNDVGLLSEEYDTRGRHLSGNFPQALSHLGLVTTALGLSGRVIGRGADT
jgi:GH15 family glucan-1,4-alpha-glucosidase